MQIRQISKGSYKKRRHVRETRNLVCLRFESKEFKQNLVLQAVNLGFLELKLYIYIKLSCLVVRHWVLLYRWRFRWLLLFSFKWALAADTLLI